MQLRALFSRTTAFPGLPALAALLATVPIAGLSQTWTQVLPLTSPRAEQGTMAYDAARGNAVLFDGADTWLWDGSAWTQAHPANAPPPRFAHAMAYDEIRAQVVLFGGASSTIVSNLNDTWVWDGSNWTLKNSPVAPSARRSHSMAFDPVRKQVILFGGGDGLGTVYGDTWAWNGTAWISLSPQQAPSPRSGQAMTRESGNGQVVMFGASGTNYETWIWDGANWTRKTPANNPGVRSYASVALVYDPVIHRTVLFGGGTSGGKYTSVETWVWDGVDWSQLAPTTGPPPRVGGAAAYVDSHDQIVFLGGFNSISGTWIFQPGALCAFTGPPPNTPQSSNPIASTGGSGDIPIGNITPGCNWTATSSDESWLTVSPASGLVPGTLHYVAAPNVSAFPRSAYVSVNTAGLLFYQDVAPCPAGVPLVPGASYGILNYCSATFTFSGAAGSSLALRAIGQAASYGPLDSFFSSDPSIVVRGPFPSNTVIGSASSRDPGSILDFSLAIWVHLPATGFLVLPATGTYTISASATGGLYGKFSLESLASGQPCTAEVSSQVFPYPAAANQQVLDVGVPPGCPPMAVGVSALWATVNPSILPAGYSRLTLTLEANVSDRQRSANLTIGNQAYSVTQAAPPCPSSISPISSTQPVSGGTGSFSITAPPGCAWSAISLDSWLTLTAGSGNGNGSVSYSAPSNNSGSARVGTIHLSDSVNASVIQAGVACTYTISPTHAAPGASGGSGYSVIVDAPAGCPWTVVSNVPWLTITNVNAVTATYSVAANTADGPRTGILTIAGQTFTVTQAGLCTYSLDKTNVNLSADPGTVIFTVTAPSACTWTVQSNVPWANFIVSALREVRNTLTLSGTRALAVDVRRNTSSVAQSGTIVANGSILTINQAGSTDAANLRFVYAMFNNFLAREPGQAGVDFFLPLLNSGTLGRSQMAYNIFSAPEFNLVERYVIGLYYGILGRDPDYYGWDFHRRNMHLGVVQQDTLARDFLNSAEYALRYGNPTNVGFVQLLYQNALGRTPSAPDLAYWQGLLDTGTATRVQVAQAILNSPEFQQGHSMRQTVFLMHATMLSREPGDFGYQYWIANLNGGMPLLTAVNAFVLSPEFQLKLGQ